MTDLASLGITMWVGPDAPFVVSRIRVVQLGRRYIVESGDGARWRQEAIYRTKRQAEALAANMADAIIEAAKEAERLKLKQQKKIIKEYQF